MLQVAWSTVFCQVWKCEMVCEVTLDPRDFPCQYPDKENYCEVQHIFKKVTTIIQCWYSVVVVIIKGDGGRRRGKANGVRRWWRR